MKPWRPARLAIAALRRCVPASYLEEFVDDLAERCAPTSSSLWARLMAHLRCWREVLYCLLQPESGSSIGGVMSGLGNDIRLALRRLRRAPLLALTTVLTFALGIGATAAIYSVVKPVFFADLPYKDEGQLITVAEQDKAPGETSNLGFATFDDVRRLSRTVPEMAAMAQWMPTLTEAGESERLTGQRVSANFFNLLGVRPMLGRLFTPDEDKPGLNRSVILSYGYWQRRFGGDSSIVGRTMQLSETPYRVVGVLDARFESLLSPHALLWAPLGYDNSLGHACRTCRHLRVVGRMAPTSNVGAVHEEMNALFQQLLREHPDSYGTTGFAVTPLRAYLNRDVKTPLLAVTGAVLLLLLITVANVANLFLARAAQREVDTSVRLQLGAGRWRVVREMIVEGVIIAVIGTLVGLAIASATTGALLSIGTSRVPRADLVRIDTNVALLTSALALALGAFCGALPAMVQSDRRARASRSVASGHRSVRRGLVVAEFALALLLLVGAGLLVQSVRRLLAVDPGFRSEDRIAFALSGSAARYDKPETKFALWRSIADRVRALPSVSGVAVTTQLPLSGDFDSWSLHRERDPQANPESDPGVFRYSISTDYLSTMGVPVVRGRGLSEADNASSQLVALISERTALQAFTGRDPIGERVRIGGDDAPWRTIVGIVGDVKQQSLDNGDELALYLPIDQSPYADDFVALVVASTGEARSTIAEVRSAIRAVASDVPISEIRRLDDMVLTTTASHRFAERLFSLFAVCALLLAAVGLYGVIAAMVTERTREIGIRTALGAQRATIISLVLRQGMTVAALGIAVGSLLAVMMAGALRTMLYGVAPRDPGTLLGVGLLLACVAVLAILVPALRASRVDAIVALKGD